MRPPGQARAWAHARRRAAELGAASPLQALVAGVEASPLATAVTDLEGRFLLANAAYCRLLGRSLAQLRELTVADVTHPEDVARDQRALRAVAHGRIARHEIRKRYLRPDGSVVEGVAYVRAVRDGGGRLVGLLGHVVELSDGPPVACSTLSEERSFRLLFLANPQPMWICDAETLRFLEVNDAACAHYGYPREELLGRTLLDLRVPEGGEPSDRGTAAPSGVAEPAATWRLRAGDGRVLEVEAVTHPLVFEGRDALLVTTEDVTERNLLERELMRQALHDPLTGLPNRALFLDRLGQALGSIPSQGGLVGVLYVDLDGFGLVNGSFGHEAGDLVLAGLGARLAAALPPEVTVGSIAGEEFAVVASGLPDRRAAEELAERVQRLVGEPVLVCGGVEIALSCCVGVTTASAPTDPVELVRDAALAAAQAKQAGAGQIAVTGERARPSAIGRLTLRHALRRAIEGGEIEVFFQPIVALEDQSIVGAEALVRWSHPERGLIAPAEFVPLAEETGLVVPLGRLVLERACEEAARWPHRPRGSPPLAVTVNVSGGQLRRGGFASVVAEVLDRTGLEPSRLALEITETVLLGHSAVVAEELATLRDLGVHVALDDFGTGYSSFVYLDRFPIDALKVDRSFVRGIHDDHRHRAIVEAMLSLARTLGLVVVAEGVETETEAEDLLALGAQFAQGFLFFAPMPADRVRDLLSKRP
jgi:diguanylate cyclase (GGDEF)-like protein/PAS domain S-box-containing protein